MKRGLKRKKSNNPATIRNDNSSITHDKEAQQKSPLPIFNSSDTIDTVSGSGEAMDVEGDVSNMIKVIEKPKVSTKRRYLKRNGAAVTSTPNKKSDEEVLALQPESKTITERRIQKRKPTIQEMDTDSDENKEVFPKFRTNVCNRNRISERNIFNNSNRRLNNSVNSYNFKKKSTFARNNNQFDIYNGEAQPIIAQGTTPLNTNIGEASVGRGRMMTRPAWMTKAQDNLNGSSTATFMKTTPTIEAESNSPSVTQTCVHDEESKPTIAQGTTSFSTDIGGASVGRGRMMTRPAWMTATHRDSYDSTEVKSNENIGSSNGTHDLTDNVDGALNSHEEIESLGGDSKDWKLRLDSAEKRQFEKRLRSTADSGFFKPTLPEVHLVPLGRDNPANTASTIERLKQKTVKAKGVYVPEFPQIVLPCNKFGILKSALKTPLNTQSTSHAGGDDNNKNKKMSLTWQDVQSGGRLYSFCN